MTLLLEMYVRVEGMSLNLEPLVPRGSFRCLRGKGLGLRVTI